MRHSDRPLYVLYWDLPKFLLRFRLIQKNNALYLKKKTYQFSLTPKFPGLPLMLLWIPTKYSIKTALLKPLFKTLT